MADVRLRAVNRDQMSFRGESVEQMLPPEHPVRDVWTLVCGWDLSAFWKRVRAVPGQAGAPAFDPRVLLTLWIQATLDGYGSSRELSELCERHTVYRWICGDVPINYHTLSDFRSAYGSEVDELLTQTVAAAFAAGIASPLRLAQDGMKVRANAGSSSFRRKKSLDKHRAEAEAQVEALKEQDREEGGQTSRKTKAARERAAADRRDRLIRAQAELDKRMKENDERASTPKNRGRAKPADQLRVSETDPESRVMRMADSGSRPAFNVQFATTTDGGIIAGVEVTNAGSDYGHLGPMRDQVERRAGVRPEEWLTDNGCASLEEIVDLTRENVTVYAPVKNGTKTRESGRDPFAPRKGDPPAVAAWRVRMGTDEAKTIYRLRGQTAEWANAQSRNHGLRQFRLRGLTKVNLEAKWFALSHNVERLRAQA
jgi:transposase